MRKFIAAAAVAAAAVGSVFGFAGHADAQTLCVTVRIVTELPAPPVALPVGLPVALPSSFTQTECLPPDSAPGLPVPLPVPAV